MFKNNHLVFSSLEFYINENSFDAPLQQVWHDGHAKFKYIWEKEYIFYLSLFSIHKSGKLVKHLKIKSVYNYAL